MPKRLPSFARVKQVAASRKAKPRLLLMGRLDANEVSLRDHAALAALRNQQGAQIHLLRRLQMVGMSGFIGEAYASLIRPEVLRAAEQHLMQALTRAEDSGTWTLDDEAVALCAAIVSHHD